MWALQPQCRPRESAHLALTLELCCSSLRCSAPTSACRDVTCVRSDATSAFWAASTASDARLYESWRHGHTLLVSIVVTTVSALARNASAETGLHVRGRVSLMLQQRRATHRAPASVVQQVLQLLGEDNARIDGCGVVIIRVDATVYNRANSAAYGSTLRSVTTAWVAATCARPIGVLGGRRG